VAFAHDLPDHMRSDRVIAEAWDTTFALFDGVPEAQDIERLSQSVPLQEAGRISASELCLSRANRSTRLWSAVVEVLASGRQPDGQMLDDIGYLMRTTAVYGSGKFGAADRTAIEARDEMQAPFQAEMLTVYLIRTFVRDLVNHMARVTGGENAVALSQSNAQRLGVGNSTGLGMAPFLIHHPILFNNWIMVREEAISRVRSLALATQEEIDLFKDRLNRSKASVSQWRSDHPIQQAKLAALSEYLTALTAKVTELSPKTPTPWDAMVRWSETALSEEGQELFASLILEPYGPLVDGLSECMADCNRDAFHLDGSMPVGDVRSLIERHYAWAQSLDWEATETCARAWYVSEEKLEPRLGERFDEPIEPYEQPLAPARDAAQALCALKDWQTDTPIAEFLLAHPEHRHTIRRAQMSRFAPYGEIHGNTIAAEMKPIDMLRAKLSFFGATRFDPRSDRWVRICIFAGAPYPEELSSTTADDWVYPAAAP
ncbi:MAG: hypothetical protein AAGA78_04565, partial [Pseudomonadota bacterium]